MIFVRASPDTQDDVWMAPVDDPAAAKPLVAGPAREILPRLSPDDRFLLYVSEESGREEVYLTTFPDAVGKWQVSSEGGQSADWSPEGDRILYKDKFDALFEVRLSTETEIGLTRPELVLGRPDQAFGEQMYRTLFGFVVGPRAERFLVIEPVGRRSEPPGAAVVERWSAQVERSALRPGS